MPKLTVNVSDTLYEQIQAYAYSRRFSNSSEAIRELLAKALLQANEKTYAPLIRTQVNEELNRFMTSFNEQLSLCAEDVLSDLDDSLAYSLDEVKLLSQASLIGISFMARPTNPDSFTDEVINRAQNYNKYDEYSDYDELAENFDGPDDLD